MQAPAPAVNCPEISLARTSRVASTFWNSLLSSVEGPGGPTKASELQIYARFHQDTQQMCSFIVGDDFRFSLTATSPPLKDGWLIAHEISCVCGALGDSLTTPATSGPADILQTLPGWYLLCVSQEANAGGQHEVPSTLSKHH